MLAITAFSIYAMGVAANPAGYVAQFEGNVTLSSKGVKRVLQPKDLERALRVFPGDKLAATTKDSKLSLVVYGRRVRIQGVGSYTIPPEDPRVGNLASRAAMAGRGAGTDNAAPFESLAILTHQTLGQTPVGNLVPLSDGRLPVVWVANEGGKHVKITLTIEGVDPVETDWIDTHEGGVEGFPFGSVQSEPLGKYILENASNDVAVLATLDITGEDGKKNTTYWEVPKKSNLVKAVESFREFELNGFDGFDEAVGFCEGTVGEDTSRPTYPLMRTHLVYSRWKEMPKQWVRLSMLHLLTLDYRFDGLEGRLKKILADKDNDNRR